MNRREQLEREVFATIITHLRSTRSTGLDPYKEVERAFPDVPDMVRFAAVFKLECEETDAWWDRLERTIDSEVLSRAISGPKGGAA